MKWNSIASSEKIEAEMPFEKRLDAKSVFALLSRTVTSIKVNQLYPFSWTRIQKQRQKH